MERKILFPKDESAGSVFVREGGEKLGSLLVGTVPGDIGRKKIVIKNEEPLVIYAFIFDSESDYSDLDDGEVYGTFWGVGGTTVFNLRGRGTASNFEVDEVLFCVYDDLREELKKVKRVSVSYSRGDWGLTLGTEKKELMTLWGI